MESLDVTIVEPIYMVCARTALSFMLFLLVSWVRLGLYRGGRSSTHHWLAWHFLISVGIAIYTGLKRSARVVTFALLNNF